MKLYEKPSYEEIIDALMYLVPKGDDEGPYTEEFKTSLLRSLLDIKNKRTYTSKEAKKSLGL